MNSNNREEEDGLRIGLVARTAGTLLVSIIVPLLTGYAQNKNGTPWLNTDEQFVVGCFIFFAITLTAVGYDLAEIKRLRQTEYKVWTVRNQADEWLQNIRSSFVTLLQEGGELELNLSAQYFMRIFSAVADDINEAAAKHELRVDELTFGTTDLLMKIMENRGNQVLSLVHALDARPNNFDFTTWSRTYYADLTYLAKTGKIAQVRRLFLYDQESQLQDGFAKHLFQFHATNKGYDFKVLHRTDWNNLVRGLGLHGADNEVGIWGDFLAYNAIRSSSAGMQGVYTSLPRQVQRLRELFDAGWRLGEKPQVPFGDTPVTVSELFAWSAVEDEAMKISSIPPTGLGLTGEGTKQVSILPGDDTQTGL
jgi:hypothetical protein